MSTQATVEELRSGLSRYLAEVEKGNEVVVCRSSKPIARIVPAAPAPHKNRTQIGWADNTLRILGPVTGPVMEGDWEMLK
jgi:prevent-host-death family protein